MQLSLKIDLGPDHRVKLQMTTYNASTTPNAVNRFPNSLRAMPIKVVYTLNDNIQQFFLARHTPIAVRLVKKAEPTRRQRQKTAKQLRRGSSASISTPSKLTRSTPTRRSQTGAEKGEVINVDEMAEEPAEEDPEDTEYGFAPLKVCVKAVWAASPDLAYDRSREWSIYCLDPMEQSGSKATATESVASKFSGVMTGMGLVSHALQEDDRTLSPVSVTGRIIDDQGGEALEVILQMKSTMTPNAMANPYAGWPQHQMMYGYPQHPSFYRAATASMLAAQQRIPPPPAPMRSKSSVASGSTPAPSDAPTPELSAATPYTESSQETISTVRSSSMEPTRKVLPKFFTQQPLNRVSSKVKKPTSKPAPAQASQATPADIFVSLATRLNSVDGGSEPPAPDTEEGQLLDCMVAWLKTAAGARIAAEIGMAAPTPAASSEGTDGSTPAEAIEIPASPPPAKASSSQIPQHATSSRRLSGSQPKAQAVASTSTSSQTKSGRVVLGNKPNVMPKPNRVASGGKPVGKSMSRSVSGPHGTRKRAIDDEEYGPSKKRQKTTRSVSIASTASNAQPSSSLAKPGAAPDVAKGKGLFDFPKSSDILGINFAPKRAYTTNLDSSSPEEHTVTKKQPEPETPRPRKNVNGRHGGSTSFDLTSPFVGGEGGGADDSLFSEAGTPAVQRNFSPFKPMGRRGDGEERMTDGMRPSSPCERRATIGGSTVRMPPQGPIRMLGRNSAKTPSPTLVTRTPQPRWAADLPPSSPPPPSSPVATDCTSSTPADPDEDEAEPGHHEEDRPARQPEDGPNVNESPSKFFARYFDFDNRSDGGDLAASLLPETATEPGTGTVTPSELESEAGYGMGFDFNLDDLNLENVVDSSNPEFGSSSSFTFEDFGWSDGAVGNGQGDSSDGEFDAGGVSSDLDFDVGELWRWMQQRSDGRSSAADQGATPKNASNSQPEGAPDGAVVEEEDSLRSLLGGCVV